MQSLQGRINLHRTQVFFPFLSCGFQFGCFYSLLVCSFVSVCFVFCFLPPITKSIKIPFGNVYCLIDEIFNLLNI